MKREAAKYMARNRVFICRIWDGHLDRRVYTPSDDGCKIIQFYYWPKKQQHGGEW